MGYLKNKPGSLEAASATAIGMPEARTPAQQQTHDKMMKDFLAKGGKIQKIPAGKKTDPNKLKKPFKEDTEHFGISGIETQRPEHLDEDGILEMKEWYDANKEKRKTDIDSR